MNRVIRAVVAALFMTTLAVVIGFFSGRGAAAATIEYLAGTPVHGDFVVSPAKIEFLLESGESAGKFIAITNRLGRDINFSIAVEDVRGSSDPVEPVVLLEGAAGPYSLKPFVILGADRFVLRHGDRMMLPVEIRMPGGAEPGGRYGAVVVTAEVPVDRGGSMVTIKSRIAALVFVRVGGSAIRDGGRLLSFDTIPPGQRFFESAPGAFAVTFENAGTAHLNPYGLLSVTNTISGGVREIRIDPYYVMPDSVRLRELRLSETLPFGRYRAAILLNRGYGDIVDEAGFIFWVFPQALWVTILAAGAAVLAVIAARRFRRRS